MKKFFVLAAGLSSLALTSGAYAQQTYSVTLSGQVPQYCNISNPGGSKTVTMSNFATNGITNGNSGSQTFQVSANGSCQISWSGGQGSVLSGSKGNSQKVTYCAVIASGTSASCTTGNAGSAANGTQGAGMAPGNYPFTFGYAVAANQGPLQADTYQDTVTVTVNTY